MLRTTFVSSGHTKLCSLFLQDTLSTFPLFPSKWFNWVSSEETSYSLCSNGLNFPRSFRDLLFRNPFTPFLEWWLFNLNSSSASFINGSVKFRSNVWWTVGQYSYLFVVTKILQGCVWSRHSSRFLCLIILGDPEAVSWVWAEAPILENFTGSHLFPRVSMEDDAWFAIRTNLVHQEEINSSSPLRLIWSRSRPSGWESLILSETMVFLLHPTALVLMSCACMYVSGPPWEGGCHSFSGSLPFIKHLYPGLKGVLLTLTCSSWLSRNLLGLRFRTVPQESKRIIHTTIS